MTAYGPPRQIDSQEPPEWVKKKEARKKVLAAVKGRRREMYRQFLAKRKQTHSNI